jgi:hypothetical protein
MSKILQEVEELRDQLDSIADQEQKLIASLRDALNRVDQKLLQDVRNIAAEHEGRRRRRRKLDQKAPSCRRSFYADTSLPVRTDDDVADQYPSEQALER